jgi:hypothetical protein
MCGKDATTEIFHKAHSYAFKSLIDDFVIGVSLSPTLALMHEPTNSLTMAPMPAPVPPTPAPTKAATSVPTISQQGAAN